VTRTLTNFWLDLLSLAVMLGLAVTGGIVHFVLPAGTGHFDLLFGLGRHDFGRIHFYLAVAAVALLAVHVLLHWSWVCCVTSKLAGAQPPSRQLQTLWGLALLGAVGLLVGGGLWWASGRVERNATLWAQRGGGGREHGDRIDRGDVRHSVSPEQTARGARSEDWEHCPAAASINGRSTLAEVASASGLTVTEVKARLKLPDTTGPNERLGRLRRRYDFAIHDVRRLACQDES
jgi:hypothetical protein